MRAERLISLLMLLQTRGKLSARALAEELAVSQRTIYRDVDALCATGVPIYSEPGREGGFALIDSYRTSLTGLSEGEIRALFMLSVPEPFSDLGLSQELKAAMLKLKASLPAAHHFAEERVRQRFYLDFTWWDLEESPFPRLKELYQAVWDDRRVLLKYHPPFGVVVRLEADPYGLVAKAGDWYLIFLSSGRMRAQQVSDFIDVQVLDARFERCAGFDLANFWQTWCAGRAEYHAHFHVRVRVLPAMLAYLPWFFGDRIRERIAAAAPPDGHGRVTLDLHFDSLESARARLLPLGGAVEVLSPEALRYSMADFAEQIVHVYLPE